MSHDKATSEALLSDDELLASIAEAEAAEFAAMLGDWKLRLAQRFFRTTSRVAPSLTKKFVGMLFEKPRAYRVPDREIELKSRGTALRIPSRYGMIAAWSWGDGPLVHLVHGWEGRGAQLGAVVDPLVEQGFRVVAWDAPAHGESDGKRANAFMFAETILDVTAFTGTPYAVVAHSMGCVSTNVATRMGYTPSRFVFIAPATTPEKPMRMTKAVFGVSDAVMASFAEDMVAEHDMTWEQVFNGAIREGQDAPLTMFHDRGDREVCFQTTLRLAERWPGSTYTFTNGLGHNRILRDPAVVEGAVAFLVAGKPVDTRG